MTRDMTQEQFRSALERNGFKPRRTILRGRFEDTTGAAGGGLSFLGIWCPNRQRLNRRSTIARLLRRRREEVAKHHKREPKGGY